MNISRIIITSLVQLTLVSGTFAQTVIQPNFGIKNHETLVINKVEINSDETKFFLTVENRIDGGTFCADKNIFIIYPDGTRSKLVSSSGIPVCPDTHLFIKAGEKISFTLVFPPLKPGTEWIDLVEDCNDNCFLFYGITLNDELNGKIDEAFVLHESGEPVKAMMSLIKIAADTDSRNLGSEGLLYMSIIQLAKETGNTGKAAEWYNRLKTSGAPRFQQYLKQLNDLGIRY
jgi:hypothetical protein